MIRFKAIAMLFAVALSGCAAYKFDAGPPPGTALPDGDAIVIGRLENTADLGGTDDPNDLLGHGFFDGLVHVTAVEAGQVSGDTLHLRYFGHTYLREEKWRFHLRPGEDGVYVVCSRGGVGFICR